MELDVALGSLGLKVGRDVSKTKSHGGKSERTMRDEVRWEEELGKLNQLYGIEPSPAMHHLL